MLVRMQVANGNQEPRDIEVKHIVQWDNDMKSPRLITSVELAVSDDFYVTLTMHEANELAKAIQLIADNCPQGTTR